jgi:CheY-like chemotaxis protein
MAIDLFEPARAGEADAATLWPRNGRDAQSPNSATRTILLISDDTRLHEELRSLANSTGTLVVRVDGRAGLVSILHVLRPVAVLLDLDLPGQAAWKAADSILGEPNCPPLLLLTARREQFDLEMAIRAGSLVDKTEGPSRLLELVNETLSLPPSSQAERNAIQRVLIQWLRPSDWSIPLTPAYRFWGINE